MAFIDVSRTYSLRMDVQLEHRLLRARSDFAFVFSIGDDDVVLCQWFGWGEERRNPANNSDSNMLSSRAVLGQVREYVLQLRYECEN